MLDLTLREEFRGKRLKGTTVDFTNQSKTGALEVPAKEFLGITYPSFDLLKTIESIGPGQSRPVVLMGSRGQGKSHLLAAIYHLCTSSNAGQSWLSDWAGRLDPKIGKLKLRDDCLVIAESLHLQQYKFLWDVLFHQHPSGQKFLGRWEGMGDKKTDTPSYQHMVEMFTEQPTILILDEFQTWFEGLTNTAKQKSRNWAFNFIQILSEIAQKHPELLVLVVSVRDGNSDAYQQIRRVNPVDVDFKGPIANRDRQRLLLYRIFENRMQVPASKIEAAIQVHENEYFRLAKVPQSEHEKKHDEFLEAWPYAPHLLKLLDDQVLIATDAQETRDLIKILVDLFKSVDDKQPIITAADFSLSNEKSSVASLLDSVANQLQRDLREKAIRNLQAVQDVFPNAAKELPHVDEIVSALWLRSLTVDKIVGAEPFELQIDITRDKAIDDNQFQAELANIEDNSFNIHRIAKRLVFKNEENPQAKLLAHARNNKLFQHGEDVEHLAKEVRNVIGGPDNVSQNYRVVVLKRNWEDAPWSEIDEKEHPKNWDGRLTVVVIPEYPEKLSTTLGGWLKSHLQEGRNTIRFLLLQKGFPAIYSDPELIILARAVSLALEWKKTESVYAELQRKFQGELTTKLKSRFDRFAVLSEWNFADPSKCQFQELSHGAVGDKIPEAIDAAIKKTIYEPEEFEEHVKLLADNADSVGKLLKDLREPRPGGNPCIPWLGEVDVKERVIKMCASGEIAINVRGELLQADPAESAEDAWHRMKSKLGTGKHLDETTLHKPQAVVKSGGKVKIEPVPPVISGGSLFDDSGTGSSKNGTTPVKDSTGSTMGGGVIKGGSLFDDDEVEKVSVPHSAAQTSSLNLLGEVEKWGIGPATPVNNVVIRSSKMTKAQFESLAKLLNDGVSSVSITMNFMNGSQLQHLLKNLPDGVTYGLELEKGTA